MKSSLVAFVILSVFLWVTASESQVYTVTKKIKTTNNSKYITLSPDGRNVAYYVVDSDSRPLLDKNSGGSISLERGSLWINSVKISPDHRYLPPGVFYSYDLTISPDGSKVAYFAAEEDGKWYVWLNNKKMSPKFTQGGICMFSSDGSKVAYWGTTDNEKWSIWINENKVSPEFAREGQEVVLPVFGNGGMGVAYVVGPYSRYAMQQSQQGAHNQGFNSLAGRFSVWIKDGKASPEFDFIFPCVSYDGSTCTYVAKTGEKYSIMRGDKKASAEFDLPSGAYPIPVYPRLSYDQRKIAYGVITNRQPMKSSVWINGVKVSPDFEGMALLRSFNPDGSKVAYKMMRAIADSAIPDSLKWSIWINDKKATPEFDDISIAKEYFAKTGKLIFAGYDKAKGEILIMQQGN
jgi:hypothetical protein